MKTQITVWVYDDLWEDGYRFDDLITKRYVEIERKFAKNADEALEFLVAAYKFIPKENGTSRKDNVYFIGKHKLPCAVIVEQLNE